MAEWKVGTPLGTDQTAHAVVWTSTLAELGFADVQLPRFSWPNWYAALWGDTKTSRRLKTFGHADPDVHRPENPHFLCSRGGLPFHIDRGYVRYGLQIQLHNQGFVVHGLEDRPTDMPIFRPGLVIILDTWSPHAVSKDPRLKQVGPNKLLAGCDTREMPDVERLLPKLVAHLETLSLPPH